MNSVTAKHPVQIQRQGYPKFLKQTNSQTDIHILLIRHLEESISMMEQNRPEAAVLQMKTKSHSTKVSSMWMF